MSAVTETEAEPVTQAETLELLRMMEAKGLMFMASIGEVEGVERLRQVLAEWVEGLPSPAREAELQANALGLLFTPDPEPPTPENGR